MDETTDLNPVNRSAAAFAKLLRSADLAVDRLIYLSTHAIDQRVQVAAANSILDRAGITAKEKGRHDSDQAGLARLALDLNNLSQEELVALRDAMTILEGAQGRITDQRVGPENVLPFQRKDDGHIPDVVSPPPIQPSPPTKK